MLISKVLFSTRIWRALLPVLCLLLAVTAMALGDRLSVVASLTIVLVAVLSKATAELSGRLSRLGSRGLATRRDVDATMAALQSQADRIAAADAKIDALTMDLQAAEARVEAQSARLEASHQQLAEEVGRLGDRVGSMLRPIRRHRVVQGEGTPDLSLRTSIELLARRFGSKP